MNKLASNPDADEKIGEEIRRIIGIVNGVDEPYRLKAFEIILSRRMEQILPVKQISGQLQPATRIEAMPTREGSFEEKIEAFATKCGLTPQEFENVYIFNEDKPTVVSQFDGTDAEKQVNISRYLLTAYKEVYGIDWVSLREELKGAYSAGNLGNLAANLKKVEIFLKKGQGQATQYKIIDAARLETFKLINGLVNPT